MMRGQTTITIVLLAMFSAAVAGKWQVAIGQTNSRQREPSNPLRMKRAEGGGKGSQEKTPPGTDGRELSHARADERYTAKPMEVQPRHRPLQPLDIANEDDAWFELAELASFEFYREGDAFSTVNGVGRGAQILPIDAIEQLERTLRFDRLMGSQDKKLRELVAQVRALTEDVYRLNRTNHDFGFIAGLEESERFSELTFESMAHISRWNYLEGARDQATSVERLPGGRTVERFDEARFQQLADRDSLSTRVFQLAADQRRAESANKRERRRLIGRRTDAIRGVLQERMAAIWRDSLLPRLTRCAGPAQAKTLIDVGPPDKNSGPKGAPPLYGTVCFRNRSGQPLKQATIAIKISDNAGQESEWYVHLPKLAPKQVYEVVYPNGPRNVVRGAAERIDGTFTFLGAEGRLVDQPINLDSAAPRAPWTQEHREKTKQAIAENRKDDEISRGLERDILELVRRIYPAARNPEIASDKLISRFQKSRQFTSELGKGKDKQAAFLELERFDADSAEVNATLEVKSGGEKESLRLMGRIADELERGCVIAFVPVEGEPHETQRRKEMEERVASQGKKYGGMDATQKIAARSDARAKLRIERWKNGGLPLFTNPADFLADWDPGQLQLGSRRNAALAQSAIADHINRRKQFEFACDVLYIDLKGRLWLQHRPAAGKRSDIVYVPLRAE